MGILKGLTVVVVGAGGVLGRAVAQAAVSEGAFCVVAGRHDPGLGLPYLAVDVTDAQAVEQFVDELRKLGRRIDVAFNFTGTHHPVMHLGQARVTELAGDWNRVMATNLSGAFFLTAGLANLFVEQRCGHLVHLCSNASRLSLEGSHAYVASKHGLEGLVKSAAAQLARFGVRVNGLAPGTVETPLNRHLLRDEQGQLSLRAASILAHTPTKRFATVEGVVESAIALCLPQRHLTGNVIFCDDGYTIEGHSWPEGTRAVYQDSETLGALLNEHSDVVKKTES